MKKFAFSLFLACLLAGCSFSGGASVGGGSNGVGVGLGLGTGIRF